MMMRMRRFGGYGKLAAVLLAPVVVAHSLNVDSGAPAATAVPKGGSVLCAAQVLQRRFISFVMPDVPPLADSIGARINRYRKSLGLGPFVANKVLRESAQSHSIAMAERQVGFGHAGFPERRESISRRLAYRAIAENVGFNMGFSDPAGKVVDDWLRSSGHRENIEGDFDLVGIGVAKNLNGEYYFTMIFVKP